jgi:phosphopantothenoylcysteine decarboxylase/phosphopantothenate--cysteine ligase
MHTLPQKKSELAESFGHIIIPAENGELASGLIGQGRMAEPATILSTVEEFFTEMTIQKALKEKQF